MSVIFNFTPQFEAKLKQGFADAVKAIEGQTLKEITSPQWDYPRETKRRNGSVVSTPRDIVDLGTLKNSLSSQMQGDKAAVIGTSAEYSLYVHEGWVSSLGTEVPSRPYLETGFSSSDRLGLIQQAFDNAVGQ